MRNRWWSWKMSCLPVVFRRQRSHADSSCPSGHPRHAAVAHPHRGGRLTVIAELIRGPAAKRGQVLAVGLVCTATAAGCSTGRSRWAVVGLLSATTWGCCWRGIIVETVVGRLLVMLVCPVLVMVGGCGGRSRMFKSCRCRDSRGWILACRCCCRCHCSCTHAQLLCGDSWRRVQLFAESCPTIAEPDLDSGLG